MIKFLFIALLIVPLAACDQQTIDKSQSLPVQALSIVGQDGKTHNLEVELALTPKEMATGLMFRESMEENHGMLFFFGQEQELRFWMKNTLIPLDMLFIKSDGTIHHIHENAIPHDLTGIPSQGPVSAVLEINGGLAAKWGISKDDKVKHELFDRKAAQ